MCIPGPGLDIPNLMKAAMVDVLRLYWSKAKSPNEILYHLDINAHYLECASRALIPTGEPGWLFAKDRQRLSVFQDGEEWKIEVDNEPFIGAMKCVILLPKCEIPPIATYVKGKPVTSVCYKCCKFKSTGVCKHTEIERAFEGQWLSIEILHCLNEGGKLLEWFEVIYYKQSSTIFKDFCRFFGRERIAACGRPEASPQDFVSTINAENNFEGDWALNEIDFQKNDFLRYQRKLAVNGTLGRFAYNSKQNQNKSVIVTNINSFIAIIEDDQNDILGFKILSERTLLLTYSRKKSNSQNSNLIVGSFIPALGRISLYNHIKELSKIPSFKLYMMHTDSLIFTIDKSVQPNLPISAVNFGQFKYETDPQEVVEFMSLGIKSYCLILDSGSDQRSITKICGLRLESESKNQVVQQYTQLVQNRLKSEYDCIQIKQLMKSKPRSKTKVKFHELTRRFSNEINNRRFLGQQNGEIRLLTWGTKEDESDAEDDDDSTIT